MQPEVQFVRVTRGFSDICPREVLKVNAVCRAAGTNSGCVHVERHGGYRIVPESHVEYCDRALNDDRSGPDEGAGAVIASPRL